MAKTSLKPPIAVPSLNSVFPAYGALKERQLQLDSRRRELENDLQRIRRGRMPKHIQVAEDAERHRRAVALVADIVEDANDYRIKARTPLAIEEHQAALRQELDDVENAIVILNAELPAAERAANDAAVAAVKAEYSAAMRDLAVAVAKTASIHDRIRAATNAMNHEDIRWVGRLPDPTGIGQVFGDGNDRDTRARRFLNDCIAAGVVGAHEVEAAANV